MRICYVAADVSIPGITGSSTHTYETARHLNKLGHKVFIVSRRESGQGNYELLDDIHLYRIYRGIVFPTSRTRWKNAGRPSLKQQFYHAYLHTFFFIYAGLRIAKILKIHNIDVIIERGTSSGEGALASIITGRPLILEIISPHYASFSVRRAKNVLTFSKKALRKVSESKIEVVTAAANTELFNPNLDGTQIRKKYGLKKIPVIGYVGSFAPWHGIETLIYATKFIVKSKPNTKLFLVGPYPPEIPHLLNKLSLTDNVVLTGPVPYRKVPFYLAACDILVAPYSSRQWSELYSYVKIYEYMAMGKPVITTDVIPDAKIIQEKEVGILVPPDDPRKLSEAIIRLLIDEGLVFKLANRARQVSIEYSWQSYAKRLVDFLKKALKDNKVFI